MLKGAFLSRHAYKLRHFLISLITIVLIGNFPVQAASDTEIWSRNDGLCEAMSRGWNPYKRNYEEKYNVLFACVRAMQIPLILGVVAEDTKKVPATKIKRLASGHLLSSASRWYSYIDAEENVAKIGINLLNLSKRDLTDVSLVYGLGNCADYDNEDRVWMHKFDIKLHEPLGADQSAVIEWPLPEETELGKGCVYILEGRSYGEKISEM